MTAIIYLRKHAAELNIESNRIGVLGFSAGGSLAIHLSLSEQSETRPDFAGFIYSVFRPEEKNIVPPNAPPAFIACATDDKLASSTNSINLYNMWIKSNNSAELHIYARGGHGLRGSPDATSWIIRFQEWMVSQGF